MAAVNLLLLLMLFSFSELLVFSVPECDTYTPRLYSYQISSGDVLHAMVFKPHSFEPNKKYPCVLNVYGGPEVQLVSNTFKVTTSLTYFFSSI